MASNTYNTTKETINYARLSRLLVDICADVLRKLLEKRIPLAQFPQKTIHLNNRFLNKKQKLTLGCFKGTYNDFDISLLYVILRNIGGINPPTNKWGMAPDQRDRSLAANIERIHIARNMLGHSTVASISDNLFKSTWDDLELAVKEIENNWLSGQNFQNAIPALLKEPVDLNTIASYIDKIKDFDNKICETDQKVGKLEGDLKTVNQTIQTNKGEINTIDEKVTSVEARVNEEKQNRDLEMITVKGDIQNTKRKVKSLECKTTHKMRKLESDAKHAREEIGQMKNSLIVATAEGEQGTSKDLGSKYQHDSIKQNIIDNTRGMLEKHKKNKFFVSTRAVDEGLRILQKYGILIYKGIPGQGKTSNALEVMRRLHDIDNEYVLLELYDISSWNEYVNINVKTIVLLDDFLGSTGSDCFILRKDTHVRNLLSCVEKGNVKVIVAARTNLIHENRKDLEKHDMFHADHFVDLSSGDFELALDEKWNIFQCYCLNNNIRICTEEEGGNYQTADILETSHIVYIPKCTAEKFIKEDPIIGFPQTCFLYCTNRKYTRLGISFFKHPSESLINEMTTKRRSKNIYEQKRFAVLSCMFCNGGSISINNFNENFMYELIKSLSLGWDFKLEQVEEILLDMEEQYIQKHCFTGDCSYRFKHDTIYDAVGLSLGKHDTNLVLKYCSISFIREFVKPQTYAPKDDEVILLVRPVNYNLLSDRLASHPFFYVYIIGESPLFKDKLFLDCFCTSLLLEEKHKPKINSIFTNIFGIDAIATLDLLHTVGFAESALCDDDLLNKCIDVGCFCRSLNVMKWLLKHKKTIGTKHAYLESEPMDEKMSYVTYVVIKNSCKHGHLRLINDIFESEKCLTKTILLEGLCLAVLYNKDKVVDYFLGMKTNFIHCDEYITFLHIAALFGKVPIFKKLLDLCDDNLLRKLDHKSILQISLLGLRYSSNIAHYMNLIKCEAPHTYENIRPFEQIILDIDDDVDDYYGYVYKEMFRCQSVWSSFSVVQTILNETKIDICELVIPIDSEGNTLAHYSAAYDFESVLEFIIKKIPNLLFTENKSKLCPVHVAAYLGNSGCFHFLYNYMKKHIPTFISCDSVVQFEYCMHYGESVALLCQMLDGGDRIKRGDIPKTPEVLINLLQTFLDSHTRKRDKTFRSLYDLIPYIQTPEVDALIEEGFLLDYKDCIFVDLCSLEKKYDDFLSIYNKICD